MTTTGTTTTSRRAGTWSGAILAIGLLVTSIAACGRHDDEGETDPQHGGTIEVPTGTRGGAGCGSSYPNRLDVPAHFRLFVKACADTSGRSILVTNTGRGVITVSRCSCTQALTWLSGDEQSLLGTFLDTTRLTGPQGIDHFRLAPDRSVVARSAREPARLRLDIDGTFEVSVLAGMVVNKLAGRLPTTNLLTKAQACINAVVGVGRASLLSSVNQWEDFFDQAFKLPSCLFVLDYLPQTRERSTVGKIAVAVLGNVEPIVDMVVGFMKNPNLILG